MVKLIYFVSLSAGGHVNFVLNWLDIEATARHVLSLVVCVWGIRSVPGGGLIYIVCFLFVSDCLEDATLTIYMLRR